MTNRAPDVTSKLVEQFVRLYGTRPHIFRAPGRINLIGEHTDYNDGYVMPAAIGLCTWMAASARPDRVLHAYSDYFDETIELSLDSLAGKPGKHWSNFIRGVAAIIQTAGHTLSGANLLIHGEVPLGAGLSSSASVEVATALALMSTSNVELPPLDVAKICQRAEHEYVGTRCGIMDQFIAIFGRSGHALMLDCRSLDCQLLPLPADVRLVICNSMVKHEHAAGEYNRRREDCETGVRILRQRLPDIIALRDVTLPSLERYRSELSERVYRRCRHVITENERVLSASEALKSGDFERLGRLMYESHHSLRLDYEVSCRELDFLVALAASCNGVYGARMTGGGFGGCTLNLVRSDAVDNFKSRIVSAYAGETGKVPDIYICSAAEGAGPVPFDLPAEQIRTR